MALTHLIDTNILLEILLSQGRLSLCQRFLNDHRGKVAASDFTLHSVGIALFLRNKEETHKAFIRDMLPRVEILKLPDQAFDNMHHYHTVYNLDYDDSYQLAVAHNFGLELVTLDEGFRRVSLTERITLL
jgi:predicted nucleic acid-binding protein